MFIARPHYIYRVVDRNGLEDMLDVTNIDQIPGCWIEIHLVKTYVE